MMQPADQSPQWMQCCGGTVQNQSFAPTGYQWTSSDGVYQDQSFGVTGYECASGDWNAAQSQTYAPSGCYDGGMVQNYQPIPVGDPCVGTDGGNAGCYDGGMVQNYQPVPVGDPCVSTDAAAAGCYDGGMVPNLPYAPNAGYPCAGNEGSVCVGWVLMQVAPAQPVADSAPQPVTWTSYMQQDHMQVALGSVDLQQLHGYCAAPNDFQQQFAVNDGGNIAEPGCSTMGPQGSHIDKEYGDRGDHSRSELSTCSPSHAGSCSDSGGSTEAHDHQAAGDKLCDQQEGGIGGLDKIDRQHDGPSLHVTNFVETDNDELVATSNHKKAPKEEAMNKRRFRPRPPDVVDGKKISFDFDDLSKIGMRYLLSQRADLIAGKSVVLQSPVPAHHSGSQSLFNRLLRRLTKQLPGCAWSMSKEAGQAQVHLADVRRFLQYCEARKL